MMERRTLLGLAAGMAAMPEAFAQERFPTRGLRIVIPFAAGGSTDILARLCAQMLTEKLGQTTVAENITGAGGTIGAQRVLDAPADGYTLMAGTPGPITINPHLQPRIPYQPLRDFEPVAFVGASPAVVVVRATVGGQLQGAATGHMQLPRAQAPRPAAAPSPPGPASPG